MVWCFLLQISANWFAKFTLIRFFEKHSCKLFLNCLSLINLFGATSPLLFLNLLLIIDLLGGTHPLLFDICGRFLMGVSKCIELHAVEEMGLRFEFSLCEFYSNHGNTVACKRLNKLLYSLNKWFIIFQKILPQWV